MTFLLQGTEIGQQNQNGNGKKRAAGNRENYVYINGSGYRCRSCWTSLKCAPVAHLVIGREQRKVIHHDGYSTCDTYTYDVILYCPACEEKPDFNGAPVFE